MTIRSTKAARTYEPAAFAPRVSPTPLMFIVVKEDGSIPTDMTLAAYERALQPKELVLLPGFHYDIYLEQAAPAIAAAVGFFRKHL